jgi:putative heme-binding domain-containing protein
MFPDRKVALESTVIETTDGKSLTTLVLKESGQGVSVLTREGTVTEIPKAQIKAQRKVKTSLMTEAMADAMNQTEWRNLLAFLAAAPPSGTPPSR